MKRRIIACTLAVLAAAFLASGCGGREKPAGTEDPKPAPAGKEAPAAGPVQMKPAGQPPAATAAAGEAVVKPYVSKDDPLFGAPDIIIPAEDFTLGGLQEKHGSDFRDRAVYELFSKFFDDLKEGRNPAERLHPDYRVFLLRELEEFSGEKLPISALRLGKFSYSDRGSALAEVLLFGKNGRARGEILAEKRDDAWLVAGIFLDFDDLSRPWKGEPQGSFDPGSSAGPF